MSDRGTIIHLDNEEKILEDFKGLFDQSDIDIKLTSCQTKEEFEQKVEENSGNLRGLIFDLLSSEPGKEELHEEDAEFLDNIEKSFSNYSIPIFIYSGFLQAVDGKFESAGTVYKIDKTESGGAQEIIRVIKLFDESGFLDVFSPGGKIERDFHNELNKSFVSQFTNNNQIEEIINTVVEEDAKQSKERVEKVFKRIALRSLLTVLHLTDEGEEHVNPVEHYVRRINDQSIETGDIFYSKKNDDYILVLTPRCDLANKQPETILICNINTEKFPDAIVSSKQKKKILDAITDNPKYSGYDRYLVRSPFFKGGLIEIGSYRMIPRTELIDDYQLIVTLSDELTNEILGKFGAYFFRTGINTWDWDETIKYLESIKEK